MRRISLFAIAMLWVAAQACNREPQKETQKKETQAAFDKINSQFQEILSNRQADSLMDLVADSVDGNGYPMNPMWRAQRMGLGVPAGDTICGGFRARGFWQMEPTFGKPACTKVASRLTWDTGPKVSTCQSRAGDTDKTFHGHINWFPVTYTGQLVFEDASQKTPIIGRWADKDYNFALYRPDSAGVTTANPGRVALHVEMDRTETLDVMQSPWWRALADSLVRAEPSARSMIDRHLASVLGLFGLDGVHAFVSELHPVYALAVQSEFERQKNETWRVFVRRTSKNEGYCSVIPHPLEGLRSDTLRIDLPWHPNAATVAVDSTQFPEGYEGARYIGFNTRPGRLSLLFVVPIRDDSKTLPRKGDKKDKGASRPDAFIDGSVHLSWSIRPKQLATVSLPKPSGTFAHSDEAEAATAKAFAMLSPSTQKQLMVSPRPETETVRRVLSEVRAVPSIGSGNPWPDSPNLAFGKQSESSVDALRLRRDSVLVRLLCQNERFRKDNAVLCGLRGSDSDSGAQSFERPPRLK